MVDTPAQSKIDKSLGSEFSMDGWGFANPWSTRTAARAL